MKRAAVLLSLLAVLLAVPTAEAGGRWVWNGYYHRWDWVETVVERVTVVDTLLVPVATPAQLFRNLSPVASYPPTTISASAFAGVQSGQSDLLAELKAMRQEIAQLKSGRGPLVATAPRLDLPPPLPGYQPTPQQQVQEQPRPDPAALLGQVAGVLQARCAMCHTSVKSRGDVQLFSAEGALEITGADPETIWREIRSDRMPKLPQKATAAEKDVVKRWADSQRVDDGRRR